MSLQNWQTFFHLYGDANHINVKTCTLLLTNVDTGKWKNKKSLVHLYCYLWKLAFGAIKTTQEHKERKMVEFESSLGYCRELLEDDKCE